MQSNELAPGAAAVIALVQNSGPQAPFTELEAECPFPPLVDNSKLGAHSVRDLPAFHVRSSEPVFATYVQPYAVGWETLNAVTATTALRSTGSWDQRNVDVGVLMPGRPLVQHEREGNPIHDDMAAFLALASTRDTHVRLRGTEGVEEFDIAAGHVVRLVRDDKFIGSTIVSDAPIATFVGSRLSFLPYNFGGSDPILNQVPAPRDWGSEYAAVRYPDRYAGSPDVAIFRVIGDKNGTQLSYEPARPDGAPETIDAGQLATFITGASFIVRSQDDQHPFYLSVAMTGYEYVQPQEEFDRGITGRGDPELVSLVPRKDFANRFAFMTEHTYPDVSLVLVRAKANGVFHPVTLECAGVVTGWQPLGSGETYETATVTLSAGRFDPQVYAGGTCHNGPHTMASDGPFAGYVWGWGHEGAIPSNPATEAGAVSFGFALYGLPGASSVDGR